MSIELQELFEENTKSNHSFNSDIYFQHMLNLSFSNISKSKFAEHYHFLCKKCNEVPVIKFIKKNKIKYKCKCKESPRVLLIKDIFDYLLYSEEIDTDQIKLKCNEHKEEKYIFYCDKCKKNICNKCIENCIEHENRIKALLLDRNTINRSKYIIKKIEEENSNNLEDEIKSEELEDNNISTFKIIPKKSSNNNNNNNENNISNDDNYYVLLKEKKEINEEIKEEDMINIINDNNNDEINDEEYYSLNLFSIIIDDYKNYPNYNHIETISNLEKYISFSFGDYNEINLKYEFNEENINFNSLEIFGEIFVNNNKENCFLIINEKIMELSRYINLSDIYDTFNQIINWPLRLDIKLIEQKNKVMNNISFMFYGINTLLSSSDFSEFETINITKMSYMFYNCSLFTQLPDISKFNTKNVTDMSYMFYNCSSLTQLPDISKFNTKNVTDMSYMFYNCSSLTQLPDISKWNMENISDFSYIFCNCESLILIPDISNWNLNKNKTKNFNHSLKNRKSLSKIPQSSKWKLNKELHTSEMFEGCRSLERDFKEKEYYKEKMLNCFKVILNKITCCILFICEIIFVYSLMIFVFVFLLFVTYYPIYISFNLVEAGYSTKNPLEYFKLNNNTNITFIAGYYNITNLTIILEQYENEENFLNNKINFTSINKDIPFESDHKNYKILTIISAIFETVNFIILSFILFNKKINCTANNIKIVFCLIIIFIFYVFSIILLIIILIIINRLHKSLSEFYLLIEYLFNIKIEQFIWNELIDLDDNFDYECFNIIIVFLLIITIFVFCVKGIESIFIRSNRFIDRLIGLN